MRLSAVVLLVITAAGQTGKTPPQARRVDFRETLHGVELSDPYHWLEDFDSPDARAWIDTQDRHARSVLAALSGQTYLKRRLAELVRHPFMSAPFLTGGWYFYTKGSPEKPQPVLCRRKGVDGAEEVWLDPESLGEGSSVGVQALAYSVDGKRAAYVVRRSGEDEVEVRVRDIDGRRDLPDRLPKALYGGAAFVPDGSGFYYGRRSRQGGSRILFHQMGSDAAEDREIFGSGLPARVFLRPAVTRDGRWLVITASFGWAKTEIHVRDLRGREATYELTGDVEAQFSAVEAAPGKLLLVTTWKAPRRRAVVVDLEDPEPERWREVIPESGDTLEDAEAIAGRIYASFIHNVQSRVKVYSLTGELLDELLLPASSRAGIVGQWDQPEWFLLVSTFTSPPRIERFNTATGKRTVWFERTANINPAGLEGRQVWYTSKDGTRVPMYLVHRKGLKPDGNRPVFLTGYGGFNVPMLPAFAPLAVIWAELDGVWAQPNLRGGAEFGEEWHSAGMLDRKQNVFDDFLGAAEWLVANGYTKPSRIAIHGVSNGGLLVGAALTQRPDLFRAVLCGYPDLDMVRYYRYTKNNNPPALLEYGDGANPKHFPFLRSWSPYERVTEGVKYPAVLLTTGEGDTRVPPQQAVKMAAKLQWATRSGRPVLLRFDRKSGHAGGRTADERIEDTAAEQAFLMNEIGLKLPGQ